MRRIQFQEANRTFVTEPEHRKWNDGRGHWQRGERVFDKVWTKLNRMLAMRGAGAHLSFSKVLSASGVTLEEWGDVVSYVKERSPDTWKVFKSKLDQLERTSGVSASRGRRGKR